MLDAQKYQDFTRKKGVKTEVKQGRGGNLDKKLSVKKKIETKKFGEF